MIYRPALAGLCLVERDLDCELKIQLFHLTVAHFDKMNRNRGTQAQQNMLESLLGVDDCYMTSSYQMSLDLPHVMVALLFLLLSCL